MIFALSAIDHLVVAARTLDEGSGWLQDRLGVRLSTGGEHPTFGTHNRLLSLGDAYLEVLAINPDAPAPARPRWFGLDTPEVRDRLSRGPCLLHWVARTPAAPLPAQGNRLSLSRGSYTWTLTVPGDGLLPLGGALPSLIEWNGPSPAAALPDLGVSLTSLSLLTPEPEELNEALLKLQLAGLVNIGLVNIGLVSVQTFPTVQLRAVLHTPDGEVVLE